jgi:hypothetical protein
MVFQKLKKKENDGYLEIIKIINKYLKVENKTIKTLKPHSIFGFLEFIYTDNILNFEEFDIDELLLLSKVFSLGNFKN